MSDYLIVDAPTQSPELRHEIGEAISDDVIFLETSGKRIVVASGLEETTLKARDDVVDEFWSTHDLGAEDLVKDPDLPTHLMTSELTVRALERAGVSRVVVPSSFRVADADYLRDKGVEIVVGADEWKARRRRKTPWELEGIERAQRATETALVTAARMLREAEPTNDGKLRFEGEILTSEWIRAAMSSDLLGQGAESEEIIVQSGDACLEGHELGSGPILPNQSCIIDCFPRERRTGVYSDTTRTFVPGKPSAELKKLHQICCDALEIALENIKPGIDDAHNKVAEYFHSQGMPTREYHTGEGPLKEGFFHSLGHGVGLEVHEAPALGRRPDALQDGDVVAIEPGLYFRGVGGVRLEDTVLVTDGGAVHFTDPLPYDLTP